MHSKKGFLVKNWLLIIKVFIVLSIWGVFYWKARAFLDPDFGWHWKMGEIILNEGLPKSDPFSYTMPSFSYVDHEWLSDIFLYLTEVYLGWSFLAFLFAFLAVITLIISLKGLRKLGAEGWWEIGLFILGAGAFRPFLGVRPQVLGWFYLALLLSFLKRDEWNWKKFFAFCGLILLWVNTHGSFALGVFCLFFWVFLKCLRKKKLLVKEICVVIVGIILTFVNPYREGVWVEVWRSVSDPFLRWRIVEWHPSFLIPVFPFLFLVSISFLVYKFKKDFSKEILFLFVLFLVQSFTSLRNIPLFVVFCLPLYSELGKLMRQETRKFENGEERLNLLAKCFFVLALMVIVFSEIIARFKEGEIIYPSGAVGYLRENFKGERVFAPYEWGGFLIWKLPGVKVFIDGRMPSWRRRNEVQGESKDAMKEYIGALTQREELEEILDKYQVKKVVWKKEEMTEICNNFRVKFLFCKNSFKIRDFLIGDNWSIIYQDDSAVIYGRD